MRHLFLWGCEFRRRGQPVRAHVLPRTREILERDVAYSRVRGTPCDRRVGASPSRPWLPDTCELPPDSAEVRPQTCSQRLSRQHKTPYAGVWSRQRHGVRARPRLGTSLRMIERHCGALIDGAHARIVARLDALEAAAEREVEAPRASERRSARVRPAPLLDGKRARWRKPRRGAVLRARSYAAVGGPNQVVSASASPSWVWSPTQATYPSGRINKAVGAMTAPSAGSSHVPAYLASI